MRRPRRSGGDRCQDLTNLRGDHALVTLSGHPLPAVLQQGAPGELLLDGRAVQHLAVATNRAGEGLALLQRHRAKAACFRLNGLT